MASIYSDKHSFVYLLPISLSASGNRFRSVTGSFLSVGLLVLCYRNLRGKTLPLKPRTAKLFLLSSQIPSPYLSGRCSAHKVITVLCAEVACFDFSHFLSALFFLLPQTYPYIKYETCLWVGDWHSYLPVEWSRSNTRLNASCSF